MWKIETVVAELLGAFEQGETRQGSYGRVEKEDQRDEGGVLDWGGSK